MNRSNALRQGLRILEVFQKEGFEALTFSQILARLDVPRSSAFRLVATLQELGYLRRDSTKYYRLGSRVMQLGFSFLASYDIVDIARPELLQLRAVTDCATYLAVLESTEIVCLSAYPTHRRTPAILTVGSRFPAQTTPMGRMLLAHQTDEYLAEHLGSRVPSGLDSPDTRDIADQLRRDRERGYVISHSQFASGIASVAAPVFDRYHNVVAAISAGSPDLSIPVEQFDTTIMECACRAARMISALLG